MISPSTPLQNSLLGEHLFCFACGELNPLGLKIKFQHSKPQYVCATWNASQYYEGYYKTLTGGVIATLLESAMLHVLFAQEIKAKTLKLSLHYHQQVSTDNEVEISAQLLKTTQRSYHLDSTLHQNGYPCVSAIGKFSKIN